MSSRRRPALPRGVADMRASVRGYDTERRASRTQADDAVMDAAAYARLRASVPAALGQGAGAKGREGRPSSIIRARMNATSGGP
jgi:hypothetical protein